MKKKFLEIFGFGHSEIPAGAQSETSDGVMVGSTNELIQRVDTGEYEVGQVGVEYRSNNQYDGIYGTVYRQYHGAVSNGSTISTPGIVRVIMYGGRLNGDNCYHGHAGDGTSWVHAYGSNPNVVTFSIGGWTVQSGWVDYIK